VNLKNKAWKYATAFVVALIIPNPEAINLALLIDSIGLEIFLIMIEIQMISVIGILLRNRIMPTLYYLWRLVENLIYVTSWKQIKEEPAYLIYVAPSQAILMHTLVILAVVGCGV
jgi:hypothetical protein